MFRRSRLVLAVIFFLSGASDVALGNGVAANAASGARGDANQKVDEIFSAWSQTPATPGCALGVVRGGKILYSRGYGMADVEHDSPITPETVFHVASVSKQFTAMAIYLLAQDGRLSIDDDVHKYLPELHDFGAPLTIRQLLHHTSGLRDQWELLLLAGWRLEDVITERDILDLVWRQKELNFAPGEQFLYSNTGYTLLGVIVKRVSGKSLREFTNARIFQPLGMMHTQFHDEYGALVKGRAYSYALRPPGGYQAVALSYSNVGATSLFTTVDDLARWDENFYTGQVGGRDLLLQMQAKGVLNSGKEVDYASGLELGRYGGLRVVEHGGEDAGFRAEILRFPDQRFSVIVLCNAAETRPGLMARKIADRYLENELGPAPSGETPKPLGVKIDPGVLDSYVGDYALGPNLTLNITRSGDQLVFQAAAQPALGLVPASDTSFFPREFAALLTFDRPGPGGKSGGVTVRQNGRDVHGVRIERARPTTERLQAYVGTYFSDELHSLYFLTARDGKLFLRYPRGEIELLPLQGDAFAAQVASGRLDFTCAASNRCESFRITTGRVRNLRVNRVELGK